MVTGKPCIIFFPLYNDELLCISISHKIPRITMTKCIKASKWPLILNNTEHDFVVSFRLVIQAFCVLPGIYFIILRMNPYVIFRKVSKALTTAFIIASR